jgi:ribosomal RNA-processing protein 12
LINRDPSEPGRAFLLPLLRNRTTNTSLAYFTKVMVPLSERLFNAKTASESVRPIEAKVYEALVDQVWACLKGFCDVPIDLTKVP